MGLTIFSFQIVSPSQAGDIQFLDIRNQTDAYLTIDAHRGSLTALAIHKHAQKGLINRLMLFIFLGLNYFFFFLFFADVGKFLTFESNSCFSTFSVTHCIFSLQQEDKWFWHGTTWWCNFAWCSWLVICFSNTFF